MSFHCSLNRSPFLACVTISDSGQFRLNVYNTSAEAQVLPGRTFACSFWYSGPMQCRFLPVWTKDDGADRAVKAVFSVSGDLFSEFPEVFDDEAYRMTPAMKSMRVDIRECRLKCDPAFGGQRTCPKIDHLVPEHRIREELDSFLKKGFIERVNSSDGVFLTPIFFLPKKDGKKIRTLNDYRKLNAMCDFSTATFVDTMRTIRSIPRTWKHFSKLDLSNAFFSVGLSRETSKLFGFNIFNETYVWRVIPQGFGWSPIWFVERVKDILHGLPVTVYADDVLVGADTRAEHDQVLRLVLRRFEKFGLRLNKDKAIFGVSEVDFLGFRVRAGGFSLKHYMEEKATKTPKLEHYKQLEKTIGALSFCRSHVPNLSKKMTELYSAKQKALKCPKECDEAWWKGINAKVQEIWTDVVRDGVDLCLGDSFGVFELFVDWSGPHRGYILFGKCEETKEKLIVSVGSVKDPIPHQSSFLGELRTVKWALQQTTRFRGAARTEIFIDNKSVVDALNRGIGAFCDDRRCARVFAFICENERDVKFSYLPGNMNQIADQLSRVGSTEVARQPTERAILAIDRPSEQEIERKIRSAHFGHWGYMTTLQNLLLESERWPNMERDVRDFVARCPNCAFNGEEQRRDAPSTEISRRIGERVFMDHCGPFFDGSHILVIVDDATKWIEAIRTPGTGAVHAMKALDRWQERHGRIELLCTDNASAWNSDMFRRWAASRNIDTRRSPSYHHQANGLAERSIQTLCERVRRLLNGSTRAWPQAIQGAVDAINTSWNSVTKTTPQSLMLGIDRNGVLLDEEGIQRLWESALKNSQMAKVYENNRFKWKHPRLSKPIRRGDCVLLKNYHQMSHPLRKLGPKWIGPFMVEEQRSDSTWIIRERRNSPPVLAHSSQIKPYLN